MLAANYRTKQLLKACVGKKLQYSESSMFGPEYKDNGTLYVVGPSLVDRKWFAQVTMEAGLIKGVR